MLIDILNLGSMGTNCYICRFDNDEAIVFDPAGDFNILKSYIVRNGIKISKIILTHGHFDHIGAVKELHDYTDAPVYIHEYDERCLREGKYSLCDIVGVTPPGIYADVLMHDGDIISTGNTNAYVYHTPGHTPGSVCVYFPGEKPILFSGDTIFYRTVGRTDFPGGDETALYNSIRRLKKILPPNTVIYPGHEKSTVLSLE